MLVLVEYLYPIFCSLQEEVIPSKPFELFSVLLFLMFMMIGSTARSTLLVFSDEMDKLRGDLKNRLVINDDGRSVREELSLLAWCQDLRSGYVQFRTHIRFIDDVI